MSIADTARRRLALPCIAPDDDDAPRRATQFWVFLLVFIPWLLLYEGVVFRGPATGAFKTYLPGEWNWPVLQWMEIFYVSPYVLVTLAPLLAPTNRILRRFAIAGLIAIVLANSMFLLIPAIAPPRPFTPSGILGQMMLLDRRLDLNNGAAAFPSFHVVWSFLGAAVFACRWPRWRAAWWTWATLVAASCVFTGMHSLADVIAGFLLFLAIHNYPTLLAAVRKSRIAVS